MHREFKFQAKNAIGRKTAASSSLKSRTMRRHATPSDEISAAIYNALRTME